MEATSISPSRSTSARPAPLQLVGGPGYGSAPGRTAGACNACSMRHGCIATTAEPSSGARLLVGQRRVRKGQALYREGAAFHYVYALRAGSFKISTALDGGREQVTGFPLRGDLIGFDGLATGFHASTATALEDAEVCVIPFFEAVGQDADPSFGSLVAQCLGTELLRDRQALLTLANRQSDARLAAFLLQMAQRMQLRGWSPSEFILRMSRAELGSYLGLTMETVSRNFSEFARLGLLTVRKRRIRLLQPQRLAALCDLAALPYSYPETVLAVPPRASGTSG